MKYLIFSKIKNSDKFLLTLLIIDIVFIILSLFDSLKGFDLINFKVYADNQFAEKFQYLKFIGISILSFLIAIKNRAYQFLVFMIIPIYLYLDDSLQLHETWGIRISDIFNAGRAFDTLIYNLDYQDIGQLLYMSVLAFILLIPFIISFKLSTSLQKCFLKKIFKLFIIFGFFAIFVDFINQLSYGLIYASLNLFEEGGEMICISFITAYFFEHFNIKNKSLNHLN